MVLKIMVHPFLKVDRRCSSQCKSCFTSLHLMRMWYCSHQSTADKETGNFFSPVEGSDDEEDAQIVENTAVSAAGLTRLPNPLSGVTHGDEDDDGHQTSVFTNYFHKAEEAKLAVLEHHVKLTTEQLKTNSERTKRKIRKGVCISFQRGRCRFGDKCRFAHSLSSEANETGTDMSTEMSVSTPKFGLLPSARMPLTIERDDDDDSFNAEKKRKHRSGVTDTLQPPKRAMKSLEQQRKEERPWTVTQR